MSRSLAGAQALFAIGLISSCFAPFLVAGQAAPPPDQPPREAPKAAEVTPSTGASAGPGAAVDSNSYKVNSPDTLNVKVWHEQDFSGIYTVHPDGKITLPLIGDIQAGGRTPVEVQASLKEALAKYVVNPLVTVTVQDVLSKKYYMDGEINHPGEYALVSATTILEAISKAGGLAPFANPKKIYVLRGDKRITFNYKDVIHGKHLEQNVQIEPGDHIVTP